METLAREARRSGFGSELTFLPPTHSGGAAAATHMGDADMGVLTRSLSPTEETFGLQYLHMARDGLVFATHRDVEVQDLTSDQVRRIYSGQITNWREVGGQDAEIVVLDRPDHTSPKILLRSVLFGKELEITESAAVLERPSMMDLSLVNIESSLGYASLGEILSKGLNVNVLSLDGIAPTPQNVEESLYPLVRYIGVVIQSEPSREVMRFIDFVYQDAGSQVIRSGGYSPVLMSLVIATIPEQNAIRQEERYRPLVDHLSEKLGPRTRVRLKHLPSYENLVEEFMRGRVNAAFFGSFTYVKARARVGVEPVARPETGGNSWYKGLIFTRKDSGVRSWRDLRGRSFSMIADTTAGEIFPRVYLERHGIEEVEEFFGRVVQAGSHDTSVLKVLNGEVAAGAAKDLVYWRLAAEDPRIEKDLRILAESPPVPDNALVIRSNIHNACISCHQRGRGEVGTARSKAGDFHAGLRRELLGLEETPEGRRILEAFGADRFLETSDEDYANLYDMISELGLQLSDL